MKHNTDYLPSHKQSFIERFYLYKIYYNTFFYNDKYHLA